jgi:hypothetical protein
MIAVEDGRTGSSIGLATTWYATDAKTRLSKIVFFHRVFRMSLLGDRQMAEHWGVI